ncbi:MAG TPA: DUF2628 domain-containing protein [Burkholderiales bacterium]|jgi:hypothetical protein
MSEANPYATPEAPVVAPVADAAVDIDALDISDTWKKRFKAMRKAGYPERFDRNALDADEKKHLQPFNILGYLFGPFYYFSKGMWKKGILLTVGVIVIITLLDIALRAMGLASFAGALKFGGPAVFAAKVNMDYYKTMVRGDKGWW